jgi:hypothetical protein
VRRVDRDLNTGEFSAVPSGLLDGGFLTQDYVLGYFQTSPFDKLRAGSSGLSAVLNQALRALR